MLSSRMLPLLALMIVATSVGCTGLRSWRQPDAFAKQPCALPQNASVEQIVEFLNANVDRVESWRARSLSIRANGIPLDGELAVQKGRFLRLMVNAFGSTEVDLGSNPELFWFWARHGDRPELMFASHEQAEAAAAQMNLPFEPGWLLETLGVEYFNAENMHQEAGRNPNTTTLVANHTLPTGQQIRRTMLVDSCHGRILEHALWDQQGGLIARAELSGHYVDASSGAMLPRKIVVDWPQARIKLAMDFREIEVNPARLPNGLWQMPEIPNVQAIDVGAGYSLPGAP